MRSILIIGVFFYSLTTNVNPDGDPAKIKSIFDNKIPSVWVFTGNSITQGAKHTHGQRSYPEIFAERTRWEMGRTSDVIINTAISGNTSRNILDGFDQRVIRFHPNVVVLMIGTNDAAIKNNISINLFESNLMQIIKKIREIDAVPVLLTPSLIIADKAPERKDLEMEKYVIKIREVAEKNNVILVDNWSIWSNELQEKYHGAVYRELLNDPLHPNGHGHKEIAIALFKALSIFDINTPTCGGKYYEGEH
jgi:lysophospholipase L1-like esterase